jgi:pre-mRNA-splicing factor 18
LYYISELGYLVNFKLELPYAVMDALKAEIALKRKPTETDLTSRPTKYMRRGDIERIKQEEEQRAKEKREQTAQEEARKKAEGAAEKAKKDARVSIHPHVVLVIP